MMDQMAFVGLFLVGLLCGIGLCFFFMKERMKELEARVRAEKSQFENTQKALADSFSALSSKALVQNNESFLQLAKESFSKLQATASQEITGQKSAIFDMMKPVQESLDKVDSKIVQLEKAREGAYQALREQVKSLLTSQDRLSQETENLNSALRAPTIRGRWGEMQLRRVVELSGLSEHCDFTEQASSTSDEGVQRPDLVVNLPGKKCIIIDAKTPLSAYMKAMEEKDDEKRAGYLKDHATAMRRHIVALSKKQYWQGMAESPEFVVLFLPAEPIMSTALSTDSSLIEYGVGQGVMMATPTTLIALLRAVAYGWRGEAMAENAKKVGVYSEELISRFSSLLGHFEKLGKSLTSSVDSYNKAMGSLESRVMVSARKLAKLGGDVDQERLKEQKLVEKLVREPAKLDVGEG